MKALPKTLSANYPRVLQRYLVAYGLHFQFIMLELGT
jgi:hypothetical protein